MKLMKCPRCELNYITENEKYCKVCMREMKGEVPREEVELCSVCNEEPALPGRDVCIFCLKEMGGENDENGDESEEEVNTSDLATMDPVSTMDEIIPEIGEKNTSREYGTMETELSLETVREEEEKEEENAQKDEEM